MTDGLTVQVPAKNTLGALLDKLPTAQRSIALRGVAATLSRKEDLVVAAWILAAEEEQPDDILESSIRQFLIDLRDGNAADAVAELCGQSQKARQWLLDSTTSDLHDALLVVAIYFSQDGPVELNENAALTASGDAALRSRSKALNLLSFLIHFFEVMLNDEHLEVEAALLQIMSLSLSTPDAAISRAARNVVASWLRSRTALRLAGNAGALSNGLTLHQTLWHWVRDLTAESRPKLQHSVGFFLWLRYLELPVSIDHLPHLVRSDIYWAKLQAAMVGSDMELKKLSVAILRKSISLVALHGIQIDSIHCRVTSSTKDKVYRDFDKLCTLYETMAIGRYINQIKDSIPTLDQLASADSFLPSSWILTILRPSMSNQMQESVRDLLGNWVIKGRLLLESDVDSFDEVLLDRILPWATQGSLFSSTVSGSRTAYRCIHGDELANFISAMIQTKTDRAQALNMQAVISFLVNNRHNMSAYSLTYLVYGLYKTSLIGLLRSLEVAHLQTLLDLPSTHGLPEVTQDLMVIMCLAIVERASTLSDSNVETETILKSKLAALRDQAQILQNGPTAGQPELKHNFASIDELNVIIKSTKHTCLSGSGLLETLRTLAPLLTDPIAASNPEGLGDILDSVMDEVEIQDYPKNVLLALPSIYLSALCIEQSLGHESIMVRVKAFFDTFRVMAMSRVFMWSPFMIALRKAVLTQPKLIAKLDLVEFFASNASRMPAARAEFHLAAAITRLTTSIGDHYSHLTYEHYYGDLETLGFAAFFDSVNRLQSIDPVSSEDLLEHLLDPWVNQKIPVPIVTKWKTTEQLQTILILLECQKIKDDLRTAEQYLRQLLFMLKLEPLPRFRYLIEVMVASLISKHAGLLEELFTVLSTNDHHGNAKYMSAVIRVVNFIISSSFGTEEMALKYAERALALTASAKIIVRHEAHWTFLPFWDTAMARGWTAITANPSLIGLNTYLRSLDKSMHFSPERVNSAFDLDSDYTLINVLCGRYLDLDPVIEPLVAFEDFEMLDDIDRQDRWVPDSMSTPAMALGPRPTRSGSKSGQVHDDWTAIGTSQTSKQLALQTKGTSYLSGTASDIRSARQHPDLSVVASLVDNPYNLGGLSRVAEIFGAATLYMSSLSVLTNRDFESVAVSSHTYLDVEALKPADMTAFFARKRLEGYSIVGIEQTDRSIVLGDDTARLPRKTILVLGAERDGLPASVIAECDHLVEIPQRGYTRSMNVQTAAACVLYEYGRQYG